MGSSATWQQAMKIITRGETDKMDATAILNYFAPLHDWLAANNAAHGEFVGWDAKSDPMACPGVY